MEEGTFKKRMSPNKSERLTFYKTETFLKERLAIDDRAVKMLEKKIMYFLKSLHNEPIDSA